MIWAWVWGAWSVAVAGGLPPGMAEVDAGDQAWALGDRGLAREQWARAVAGGGPAAVAMGELRLLFVSGNLGLAVHGPRADRALGQCPMVDPWCRLAAADRLLVAGTLGMPADTARAVEMASSAVGALPGPATARLVWAGAAPVAALEDHPAGGLGAGLQRGSGGWPAGPGTWVAGVLVAGGTGQGVAMGLRLHHPDVGLNGGTLDAQVYGTTRGGVALAGSAVGPRVVDGLGRLQVHRQVFDVYDHGEAQPVVALGADGMAGVVWRTGPVAVSAGPRGRVDAVGDARWWGAGGDVSVSARMGPVWTAQLLGTAIGGNTRQVRLGGDLRRVPAGSGLATRLVVDGNALEEGVPVWWRPTAGGGQVLRHAPLGRFRGPLLGAAVVEWRQAVAGPLTLTVFGESAWLAGLHGGGGGGLLLDLPPKPSNRVRFDVAWGDGGLGVSGGIGAAF